MRHAALSFALFGAMLVATAALFRLVPGSLAPTEDQGYVLAIPLAAGRRVARAHRGGDRPAHARCCSRIPRSTDVISFAGIDVLTFALRTNAGVVWVVLEDWDEAPRRRSVAAARSSLTRSARARRSRDALILAFEPPPIEGLSATGGFEAYIQSRGGERLQGARGAPRSRSSPRRRKRKELVGVTTTFSASVPQMRIDLDREQAKLLGVNVTDVFDTLQSTFGALYVNDFNRDGRVFRVHLQSDAAVPRRGPTTSATSTCARGSGELIPLTALVTMREVDGPGGHRALQRVPVGQGARQRGARVQLGRGDRSDGAGGGRGAARGLRRSPGRAPRTRRSVTGGSSTTVFLIGVLMVFLVLAAQYERWTLPFAVILAVPFAVFGALLAVFLRGLENDIYLPDRARDAGRARVEERDPDRRVRARSRRSEGHAARRGGGRGRAHAASGRSS